MKKVNVVAGIVKYGDLILCTQRGDTKFPYVSRKFEFPGGKIEVGETKEEALRRELIEELNITPTIKDLYMTVDHQYPDVNINLSSFICEASSKDLSLNEHLSYRWIKKEELNELEWAAADEPIVEKLMQS
jgi:8-oxo-dGTP diphosphatase